MSEFKKFLESFNRMIHFKKVTERKYSCHLDLALLYLFQNNANHKDLLELFSLKLSGHDFHKAFRQTDVVIGLDSVFWQLMSGSDLFFSAYELYLKCDEFDEFYEILNDE